MCFAISIVIATLTTTTTTTRAQATYIICADGAHARSSSSNCLRIDAADMDSTAHATAVVPSAWTNTPWVFNPATRTFATAIDWSNSNDTNTTLCVLGVHANHHGATSVVCQDASATADHSMERVVQPVFDSNGRTFVLEAAHADAHASASFISSRANRLDVVESREAATVFNLGPGNCEPGYHSTPGTNACNR